MDRGIWQATVHRVAKSQTRLSEHRAEHSGFPKDTQSCTLSVHKHDNQGPGIPTPGESEGQGDLACCSPWDHRVRHNLVSESESLSVVSNSL